jgi:hypothetical protein
MAEVGKADADQTPPLPCAHSADLWDELSAHRTSPSQEVHTLAFTALHDKVCHLQRAATDRLYCNGERQGVHLLA